MAWTIEYSNQADAQLQRLDRRMRERIVAYMRRVAALDNPRQRGKALRYSLAGHWRYRVGNYRVICEIHDDVLRILVVQVDRRDQAYR